MLTLFKKVLLNVPVVRRANELVKYVESLPQKENELNLQQQELQQQLAKFQQSNKQQADTLKVSAKVIESLQQSLDRQQQELSSLALAPVAKGGEAAGGNGLFADDHTLDIFYASFEDRFRGTENEIKERVAEYLPLFKAQKLNYKRFPVLDIGSGRGEFLQVMKENKVPAEGLDINFDMVERSRAKGLTATQGNAVEFLTRTDPQKYGAITGFHIVEHIPFNGLLQLFRSAYAALTPGGMVLFETPNPENVTVGSCTFYMDPSHLHPLPPALLAFALETIGFQNIEIRGLHATPHAPEISDPSLHEIATRFYGARDYAVIGYKPGL